MARYPTSFDKEALLKCARGELFGPGNAQLPSPPMLMMDRITDISDDGGEDGKGHVVAEFDIVPDLWFFGCHFLGNPIMTSNARSKSYASSGSVEYSGGGMGGGAA